MEGIILIFAGTLSVGGGIAALVTSKFVNWYIKTPKAYIWRKMLGDERAKWAIKYIFAPIAVAVGGILVLFGVNVLTV